MRMQRVIVNYIIEVYVLQNRRRLKMNKKNVPVYTLKKMMQLVRKGFDVVNTVPNNENPNFCVFMFENTPELHEALKSTMRK